MRFQPVLDLLINFFKYSRERLKRAALRCGRLVTSIAGFVAKALRPLLSVLRGPADRIQRLIEHPYAQRCLDAPIVLRDSLRPPLVRAFGRMRTAVAPQLLRARRLGAPVRDSLLMRLRAALGNVRLSYESPAWFLSVRDWFRARIRGLRASRPRAYARLTALAFCAGLSLPGTLVCQFARQALPAVEISVQAPEAPRYDTQQDSPPSEEPQPQPLLVQFSEGVAPLASIGRDVESGVRLEPALAGRWSWVDENTLVFAPEKQWPVGTEFAVYFDEGLVRPDVRLRSSSAGFETAPLEGRVARLEYYVDYKNPADKRIVATLAFNYPVETANLDEQLRLELRGGVFRAKKLSFTTKWNARRTEVYVRSEIVPLPNDDVKAHVILGTEIRAAAGGEGLSEELAAQTHIEGRKSRFRVNSSVLTLVENPQQIQERVLVLETSVEAKTSVIQGGVEAYLLPADRPAAPGLRESKKHAWRIEEVDAQILRASERLKLEALPAGRDFTNAHSFRLEAPGPRRLYVKVNKGIKNFSGYELAADYERVLSVRPFPKRLKIMHEGGVLSLRGEKKLSVMASDIRHVKIEVERVLPENINHLVSQTRGNFQSPHFTNYSFSGANIAERFIEKRELAPAPGRMQYFAFDFAKYLSRSGDRTGLFLLRVRDYNPKNDIDKERASGRQDRRFVLVTDLGFLVKASPSGRQDVFVQSIAKGVPLAGVSVEVLGKNGIRIAGAKTDAQGRASLPSLRGFRREKEPTAFVLRKGQDVSFMPFQRADRTLNYSRFEVGGLRGGHKAEALSAFLFTERGIYRPGDRMRLAAVIKSNDWKARLAGVPLEVSISDARGLEILRRKLSVDAAGFLETEYRTAPGALTGQYQAALYTIRDGRRATQLGSTNFRVEEFLPDTLKIETSLSAAPGDPDREGWVSPDGIKARVSLRQLFGPPAVDHRVTAQFTLKPGVFRFRKYRDYSFFDPHAAASAAASAVRNLEESYTNEAGEVVYSKTGLESIAGASYRLTFYAQGYEQAGGRSVSAATTVKVSPLQYLVGLRADGDLSYIARNAARNLELIAITPTLERRALDKLTAKIIRVQYISSLVKQEDGTFRYQSVRKEQLVKSAAVSIAKSGLRYRLPSAQPGEYVFVLTDDRSNLELQRTEFAVAGRANLNGRLDRDAELKIRLNKNDYKPGEEIEVNIIAPYTGAGLVTIERAGVHAAKWIRTTTNSAIAKIRVPDDVEGNAYVNVAFLRAPDSEEIHASPLSYGVESFSISRERRHNRVQLKAPTLARPGRSFPMTVSTKRPGKVVVFAVDEGILQVARYQTPDPLEYFFRKRALETKTTQILDLILPEYSLARRVSRMGGGDDSTGLEGFINPFKRKDLEPVVYWSGVIDAGPTPQTLRYDVPEHFNGTLRVMAVSVSADGVGSTETRSTIRDHFVIQPNAPTFVAPGDEIEVTAAITNNDGGEGPLVLRLDIQGPAGVTPATGGGADASPLVGGFKLLDPRERTLRIPEGRSIVERFRMRAPKQPGAATLRFTARSGNKTSRASASLSIRPAVPFIASVQSGVLAKGDVDLAVPRELFAERRELSISISPVPLGLARGLVSYLDSYPYGCTEQMVSRGFAPLALLDQPEFGLPRAKSRKAIQDTIAVLRVRQNQRGGFGFWAANTFADPYYSVYAMHFLVEARAKSFGVPGNLLERGSAYLRRLLRNDGVSPVARAYAAYVLSLGGEPVARELARLRKSLDRKAPDWQAGGAALYMAGAYRLLEQSEEARKLLRAFEVDTAGTLSRARYIYILARHFPEERARFSGADIQEIARRLGAGFNTHEAAQAVLALDALAAQPTGKWSAKIFESAPGEEARPVALGQGVFPRMRFRPESRSLRIVNELGAPLFYSVLQAGFDAQPATGEIRNKLEVYREYSDSAGKTIRKIYVGDTVEVTLRVRALKDAGRVPQVALVDLLPGGFEAVLDSVPRPERSRSAAADSGFSLADSGHVDVREDRVLFFGDAKDELREYRYRLRAVAPGRYAIPPAYAEGMYDAGARALRPAGGVFEILPRPGDEVESESE